MEIVVFLGWLIVSLIVGTAANARGRNGFGWFLLAVLLSPLIAGFLLILFPAITDAGASVDDRELQKNIARERRLHSRR